MPSEWKNIKEAVEYGQAYSRQPVDLNYIAIPKDIWEDIQRLSGATNFNALTERRSGKDRRGIHVAIGEAETKGDDLDAMYHITPSPRMRRAF